MTKSIPSQRLENASQLSDLIAFLLSDDSGFCTGGIQMVYGGLTVS